MKFKVGDKVKIVVDKSNSINKVGDIGIIVEIENGYRVYVKGREYKGEKNISNWHWEDEMELIIENTK